MASQGSITVNTTTSPKAIKLGDHHHASNSPKGGGGGGGGGGQCLCSPTTHQGSFRCRFHRPNSTAWFKRSNSMPANSSNNKVTSTTPKSVEST
ncbi:hypothetical protein ACSBR1_039229 [Camellia fascicularis]